MLLTTLLLLVSTAGGSPAYSLRFAEPHTRGMGKLAFSPDGQLLAVGRGEEIELWTVSESELTKRTSLRLDAAVRKNVLLVAFSTDGSKLFTANGEGAFAVWRVSDGTLLQSLSFKRDSTFAISPDGKRLAVFEGVRTQLISLEKPGLLWRLRGRKGPEVLWTVERSERCMGTMAFSPDGKLLALACEPMVWLLGVEDGEQVRGIRAAQGGLGNNAIYGMAFSPDGQLLAVGGMDGNEETLLKVFRVSSGSLVHDLNRSRPRQHKRWVSGVAFSRDGQLLASASWDAQAVLWQVSDGKPLQGMGADWNQLEELRKQVERQEITREEYDRRSALLGPDRIMDAIVFHPSGRQIAMNDGHGCFWIWQSSEAAR